MLRGVATIAGGLGGNDCPGRVAALLIHDSGGARSMDRLGVPPGSAAWECWAGIVDR